MEVVLGIQLLRSLGLRKVLVEVDSSEVGRMVDKGVGSNNRFAGLVNETHHLLDLVEEITVSHIFSEQNMFADQISRLGFNCDLGFSFISCPPPEVDYFYANDNFGLICLSLINV